MKIFVFSRMLIISMFCVVIAACSEEDVSVDTVELSFSQLNESEEFTVLCPGEWHLEAAELSMYFGVNAANLRDFFICPTSGTGDTKITVELKHEITEPYSVNLKVIGKNNQALVRLNALTETNTY